MLVGELATDHETYFGHGDAVGEELMRVVVVSGRNALVVMMQSTEFGNLDDAAVLARMNCPTVRAVHIQGLMNSPAVIIVEVAGEDATQMPLAQHDHV
ncbi:hypothetical protein ACFL6M_05330, partial [Candidatus Eisenbacteria bacterium]